MITAAVIVLCAISSYTDLKYRIIPNKLTFTLMITGLLYHGIVFGLEGIKFSSAGLLLGLTLLIIPFMLGGMGGGDVKFLMAAGALGGPDFVLRLFIYSAFAGGIMALILMIKNKTLGSFLKETLQFLWWLPVVRLNLTTNKMTMPYAVCLAAGTLAVLITSS